MDGLVAAAQALESSGELEHQEAVQRSQVIQQDWAKLSKLIQQRIKLGLQYTTFHKKAQQVMHMHLFIRGSMSNRLHD